MPISITQHDPVGALNRACQLISSTQFRDRSPQTIRNFAFERAECIAAGHAYAAEHWNASIIDPALQQQVILQDILEAFAITFAALDVFTVVHNSVPLQGKDTVDVPYFPLQAAGSSSFAKATGYNTTQDWAEQKCEVSVGGDGDLTISGVNAAAGTARDRKYLQIGWTSYDLSRQPYLVLQKLAQQAGNRLALDVVTDIVTRVITAANFGAAVKNQATMSADDVADLRESATTAYWPNQDRALVVDHSYWTNLLKDPTFKQYLAYGSTDPLHQGRISNAYGFTSLDEWPNLKSNFSPAGENLAGWINHKSAALVVTSPIIPTPEVRRLLGRYDVIVDPKSNLALAYRSQGNALLDSSAQIIECAYGAAPGVAAALMRLTKP